MRKRVYDTMMVANRARYIDLSAVKAKKKLRSNVNGIWWDLDGAIMHQCSADANGVGLPDFNKPIFNGKKYECTNCGSTIKDPD